MSLNIKDLKVGDELVCIDREYFSEKMEGHYFSDDRNILKISTIHAGNVWVGEYCIPPHELKYFKKKEQSFGKSTHVHGSTVAGQYTFEALIDTANQALKDGIIDMLTISMKDGLVVFYCEGLRYDFHNQKDNKESIDKIKALYKETFVIECEKDIRRLSKGAKLTLKNGELITFSSSSDEAIQTHYFNDGEFNVIIPLVALKGATVEQARSQ